MQDLEELRRRARERGVETHYHDIDGVLREASAEALAAILHENSAGNQPTKAPILVVQGTADRLILQPLTDAYVQKACAAGDHVEYRTYDGADHGTVIVAAHADVLAWLAARAADGAVPDTCS